MSESPLGQPVEADQTPSDVRKTLRGGLIVGIFALQFLIPFIALVGSPAPSRFGFQMYSGQGKVSAYVVDASGQRKTLEFTDLVANDRTEIDWISRLETTYVCNTVENAVEVVVSQVNSHGTRTVRFSCVKN